jgi:DNA polymerase I
MEDKGSRLMLEGMIFDVDYLPIGERTYIRLAFKSLDGKAYEVLDADFFPYFCLVPNPGITEANINDAYVTDNGRTIRAKSVERGKIKLAGKEVEVYRVYVTNPLFVPRLSGALQGKGTVYENDIPFARRYIIDRQIVPFADYLLEAETDGDGHIILASMKLSGNADRERGWTRLNSMCFDIETYNKAGVSRPEKDPILMISYSYTKGGGEKGNGVITYKDVGAEAAEVAHDEKDMLLRFAKKLNDLDIDVLSGYASTNFDVKYILDRAAAIKLDIDLGRFRGETRLEKHGMIDRVKLAGRVHIDMFNVVKFISVVGASANILRLSSFKLKDVYEAISTEHKVMVDKPNIWQMWDDGGDKLRELIYYNLNDSEALRLVYDTFTPIIFELSSVSGDVASDVAVSTTSQIVEFMLMRYAYEFGELIPNKPGEGQIASRASNPIEGAFVKTPQPGIYDDLVMFDFRGLYPSIIISHNIDVSAICSDCKDYFESPTGTRFRKDGKYIAPTILKMMTEQRAEVKKLYKKDPDNIVLGSRSQALKIVANAFYGYLGYARARWYSRECAASVTAYGRQYIKDSIDKAEKNGFRVLYGDTDSILLLLGDKTREDALRFIKELNADLPKGMEMELEDFYSRGLFVGRKVENAIVGAKKKYALISDSGRIKIRGFELVRRDWSRIAQETQRRVLEVILKEGSAEKAAGIVKEVVRNLKEGKIPLDELVIRTQLRKGIYSYDQKSPEIAAARKAVESGARKREELEHSVIGYVVTSSGNSISDKAQLYGIAKDYDPDYYINHQILPATMRILKELNFDESELKNEGKQKKL